MATPLIFSGRPGTAPQAYTILGDGSTAELYLAHNFAAICVLFKDILGIETAVGRILPKMTSNREIQIEVVGGSGGLSNPEGSITLHFHILKLRTTEAPTAGPGSESAIYTVNRLINLLLANNHFENMNGICGIKDWSHITGQPYIPPVSIRKDHADQFDGGLVEVTFSYSEPLKSTL